MKYGFRILLIALFLISSSCKVTSYMWNRSYNDTIKNFLVSHDGRNVIFLGQKFHYVLSDHTNVLKHILSWRGRSILFIDTEKTDLVLDGKNNLSGKIVIEAFFSKLEKRDWVFLKSLGFVKNKERNALALTMDVKGKRYLPRNLGPNLPYLHHSYVISIRRPPGVKESIGMAALTPITITVDGVILLGKVILSPFSSN